MKVYALLTLHEVSILVYADHVSNLTMSQTGWGTRAGVGDPSQAVAAAAADEKFSEVKKQQREQSPMEVRVAYVS